MIDAETATTNTGQYKLPANILHNSIISFSLSVNYLYIIFSILKFLLVFSYFQYNNEIFEFLAKFKKNINKFLKTMVLSGNCFVFLKIKPMISLANSKTKTKFLIFFFFVIVFKIGHGVIKH